jgi:hypothetical protein
MAQTAGAKTAADAQAERFDETALHREIDAHLPDLATLRVDTRSFLVRSMLLRLGDVLDHWRDAVWLRTHIVSGRRLPGNQPAPSFRPYRDLSAALLGGAIATFAVLFASAFWIFQAGRTARPLSPSPPSSARSWAGATTPPRHPRCFSG